MLREYIKHPIISYHNFHKSIQNAKENESLFKLKTILVYRLKELMTTTSFLVNCFKFVLDHEWKFKIKYGSALKK